ncbi:MAG: thioesterase family protein [Kofleriaceae bacterium]
MTAAGPAPGGGTRYHAALDTRWDYLLPSGGVLMTVALRAAVAELADGDLRLVSATTMFCAPIYPGPLAADVVVLRRGRAAAQVRIALRNTYQPGYESKASEGLEVVATFCRERSGPDVVGARPPRVPGPTEAADARDGHPGNPYARYPFYRHLDVRLADAARPWQPDFAAGPAADARWLRYRVPQRDAAGRLDPLALPPLADTMPGALVRAIGPGDYRFYAPSLDLTLHVLADTEREWLLACARVRRARAGWATGEIELWDDAGQLVAMGTQAMFIQGVAGQPPTVDAAGS